MHELDLHDHTADEALRMFVEFYNQHMRNHSQEPLRIIHGYGSSGQGGKIRRKIRAFFEGASASLAWKTGEDFEDNPGVTIVYPHSVLPAPGDQLADDILAFCSILRTESKISGEFRKHGAREVKRAIRTLLRQARIKSVFKAGRETYVNATFL